MTNTIIGLYLSSRLIKIVSTEIIASIMKQICHILIALAEE